MPLFKTTHVGSLPRPDEMMTQILRKQDVTPQDLRRYLSMVVAKQLSIGITVINNGELPRSDYVSATVARIAGFDGTGIAPIPQDMEQLPSFSRRFGGRNGLITLNPKAPISLPACTRALSYTGASTLREELEMMAEVCNGLQATGPDSDTELFFTSPLAGNDCPFHGKPALSKLRGLP